MTTPINTPQSFESVLLQLLHDTLVDGQIIRHLDRYDDTIARLEDGQAPAFNTPAVLVEIADVEYEEQRPSYSRGTATVNLYVLQTTLDRDTALDGALSSRTEQLHAALFRVRKLVGENLKREYPQRASVKAFELQRQSREPITSTLATERIEITCKVYECYAN